MTKKTWIIFAAICVAIIGGLIYLSRSSKIDVSAINPETIQPASKQSGNIADNTFGNMNSGVVLMEYGDYQCPGCGSSSSAIKQITEKYKDKLGFVFRHFPLYTIHPNAYAAAAAAESAGLQGKYWEMHDKLYQDQNAWNQLTGANRTDYFVTLAISLGLNGDKLRSDLTNDAIKQKIDFNRAIGEKAGVTGTPAFYLNGKNVGDQYYKDGKIVTKGTTGANPVWSDATAFDTLVVRPALKEKGLIAE